MIILASSSPRRKEILNGLDIEFVAVPSKYDEKDVMETPYETILHHAREKAKDVAMRFLDNDINDMDKGNEKDAIIIGSDTAVIFNDRIIGKPKNREEAIRTLRELSGNTHEVISALSIVEVKNKKIVSEIYDYDIAKVRFRKIDEEDIRDYVDSGEPMDKAGAYAIQGKAKGFIENIEGDYYTIMGFPVELFNKLWKLLKDETD